MEVGALGFLAIVCISFAVIALLFGLVLGAVDHGLWVRMILLALACVGIAGACVFVIRRLAVGQVRSTDPT